MLIAHNIDQEWMEDAPYEQHQHLGGYSQTKESRCPPFQEIFELGLNGLC
jgi:hypothetical protein